MSDTLKMSQTHYGNNNNNNPNNSSLITIAAITTWDNSKQFSESSWLLSRQAFAASPYILRIRHALNKFVHFMAMTTTTTTTITPTQMHLVNLVRAFVIYVCTHTCSYVSTEICVRFVGYLHILTILSRHMTGKKSLPFSHKNSCVVSTM